MTEGHFDNFKGLKRRGAELRLLCTAEAPAQDDVAHGGPRLGTSRVHPTSPNPVQRAGSLARPLALPEAVATSAADWERCTPSRRQCRIAEAQSLHQRIVTQRVAHRQAEHQLAVLLAELADRRLFAELGYASVAEYGAEVLDLPKRTARDLARIGRRLDELPALAAALSAGELDWTNAREVVSIATPETAAAWAARALAVSSRVLEREVAHAKVGELPPAEGVAPERGPERVRVVLEMQASDAEVLYQAIALCRAQSDLDGEEIDDGALLAMIANNYVHAAGAREDTPTGERYRIVVQQCPECGHVESPHHDVADTVAAEAACDAEVVDVRRGESEGHAERVIPPVAQRTLLHRAGNGPLAAGRPSSPAAGRRWRQRGRESCRALLCTSSGDPLGRARRFS